MDEIRPEQNRILSRLSAAEKERLFPSLDLVRLPLGAVLSERNESLECAYFPVDCIVSVLHEMENGNTAEMAVSGNEGMVGVALFLGGRTMPNRTVVQVPGHPYSLHESKLREEFARQEILHNLLLRYTQALLTQMSQTAVCNRHHSVEQQLCRWLLLSVDRLPADKVNMTQQLIADMLGVRRAGVTQAAGKLQKLGVISYQRGHISVLDRAGLEHFACECYEVIKQESDRLLDSSGG